MLTINITAYDEHNDVFTADCDDSLLGASYPMTLPASLLPYIAHEACGRANESEDGAPWGLIGETFTLTNPHIE